MISGRGTLPRSTVSEANYNPRSALSEANYNVAYIPQEGYSTLQYPTHRSRGANSAYSVQSATLKSKCPI